MLVTVKELRLILYLIIDLKEDRRGKLVSYNYRDLLRLLSKNDRLKEGLQLEINTKHIPIIRERCRRYLKIISSLPVNRMNGEMIEECIQQVKGILLKIDKV
jgi:hypothetical protein